MINIHDKTLLKASRYFETALSVIILILVLLGMIDLMRSIYEAYIIDFQTPVEYTQLYSFLALGLLLVLVVELVVMLSLHIPGVLIEVLLCAIARKLILLPKTAGMADLLLGVLSIGLIFAIRKYLLGVEEKGWSLSKLYKLNVSENKKSIKNNVKDRVAIDLSNQ